MTKSIIAALAAGAFAWLPQAARAQGKTFTGDHYSITFGSAWDTLKTHSILGKSLGLQGMATLGAESAASLPDLDSLTAAFSDSLGGSVRKDSSGRMTIGKYDVHWQKFAYDSLPKLSATIAAATGVPVTLKNGTFRVYYLNADGYSFTLACMSIINGVKPPYADVEAALATLKLSAGSGVIPLSAGAGRDLWVKDGKLGGAWLRANRVYAVECYDTRGSFLGLATHAAEGAWQLPQHGTEMLVRLKTAGGSGLHFLVRP